MKRIFSVSLFLALIGLLITTLQDNVFAQEGTRYNECPMGHMMGWGTGWAGMIFMILFWILIIVGGIYLVRNLVQNTHGDSQNRRLNGSGRAIDILKERYARGEIDREEFEAKKKDLQD